MKDVEADLKKKLSGKFLLNPQVTVELEQTVNKRIFVTGQGVRSPGMYPYGGSEMSVLDAVTRAGDACKKRAAKRRYRERRATQSAPTVHAA